MVIDADSFYLKQEEQPPHIDTVVLKSKTVRLLLLSSSFSCPGLLAPLIFLSTGKMKPIHGLCFTLTPLPRSRNEQNSPSANCSASHFPWIRLDSGMFCVWLSSHQVRIFAFFSLFHVLTCTPERPQNATLPDSTFAR